LQHHGYDYDDINKGSTREGAGALARKQMFSGVSKAWYLRHSDGQDTARSGFYRDTERAANLTKKHLTNYLLT
jgi:hypothetical protein